MQLVELSVTNFRSLADVQGIPIRKQTILTGHNDCGKTATLDALAFLLGERDIHANDVSRFPAGHPRRSALPDMESKGPEPRVVTVEGSFELSPEKQEQLQAASPLRVRRCYTEGGEVRLQWLIDVPQDEELRGIDQLKAPELKELARSRELALEPGERDVKDSWAGLLRNYAAKMPQVCDWSDAPPELKAALPQLLYFRGDGAETPENVVRSILTAKLREHTAVEKTRKKITELEEEFSELLKEDAAQLRALVEKRCGFQEFTMEPQIQFKPSVSSIALSATAPGQPPVPLDAAGAGRSRRISLALWEGSHELLAKSGQDAQHPGLVIVYDEPDTHLDYEHQRRVMQMIKASADSPNSTVIVATHSLNLIDGVDIQDIVHLGSTEGRAYVQTLGASDGDKETRRFLSNMAVSLGFRNSVLLHEKCFIAVEGITEYRALPILFKLRFGYPMQSAGIALWDCGGNVGALQFAKFLKQNRRTVKFMVDADSKRDQGSMFNPNKLVKWGFGAQDCLYIGNPWELEDIFSGEQWAAVMNDAWPRKDEQPWQADHVDALRSSGKFSTGLKNLVTDNWQPQDESTGGNDTSERRPRLPKDDLIVNLVARLREPQDVPDAIADVFERAIAAADDAGPYHWPSDV